MARPPATVKRVNAVALRVAGTRFTPLWSVLRHRGRRSGRWYSVPVTAIPADSAFLIPLPWGRGTDWVRNVRAAGGGTIRWKGADYECTQPTFVDQSVAQAAAEGLTRRILEHRDFPHGFLRLERVDRGYRGSMDRDAAQGWLDRYVAAWRSYDRDDVADLFSEDVAYRYHPYDDPIVGRDAVVASWLGESDSGGGSTRDVPGTYEAEYHPVAVDGSTVVATGTSRYRERPDGPFVKTYENCFVMRFDDDGRCREFTEYYLLRP